MRIASLLCVLSLLIAPATTFGLGLGWLQVDSFLGEPLRARIPLRSVSPGDADRLEVRLAEPAVFSRAGLTRSYWLDGVRFEVVAPPQGDQFIRVTSEEPVHERTSAMVVDVQWPRGRMRREYVVLLEPRVVVAETPEAPSQSKTGTIERHSVAPPGSRPAEKAVEKVPAAPLPAAQAPAAKAVETPVPAPAPKPMAEKAPARAPAPPSIPGTYGPVKANETAWTIATKVRPDQSVTVQQTLIALAKKNPQAFIDGNVSLLKVGSMLKIPTREEITALTESEARTVFNQQARAWQSGSPLTEEPEAPPSEVAGAPPPVEEPQEESGPAPAQEGRFDILSAQQEGAPPVPAGSTGGDAELINLMKGLSQDLNRYQRENRELTESNQRLEEKMHRLEDRVGELHERLRAQDEQLQRLAAQSAATAAPTPTPHVALDVISPELKPALVQPVQSSVWSSIGIRGALIVVVALLGLLMGFLLGRRGKRRA